MLNAAIHLSMLSTAMYLSIPGVHDAEECTISLYLQDYSRERKATPVANNDNFVLLWVGLFWLPSNYTYALLKGGRGGTRSFSIMYSLAYTIQEHTQCSNISEHAQYS